jgi:hypothetical protein
MGTYDDTRVQRFQHNQTAIGHLRTFAVTN